MLSSLDLAAVNLFLITARKEIDKNNAYFENVVINGADVKTFKALAGKRAEDKNNYYKSEKISDKK